MQHFTNAYAQMFSENSENRQEQWCKFFAELNSPLFKDFGHDSSSDKIIRNSLLRTLSTLVKDSANLKQSDIVSIACGLFFLRPAIDEIIAVCGTSSLGYLDKLLRFPSVAIAPLFNLWLRDLIDASTSGSLSYQPSSNEFILGSPGAHGLTWEVIKKYRPAVDLRDQFIQIDEVIKLAQAVPAH